MIARTIKAIFENGVLRPLQPLEGVPEHTRVDVTVVSADPGENGKPGLRACIGSISDADAGEMRRAVDEEFERVDDRDW